MVQNLGDLTSRKRRSKMACKRKQNGGLLTELVDVVVELVEPPAVLVTSLPVTDT